MLVSRRANVLVVDDVQFMRVVLKDILINQEIASTVHEAADGLEAIEVYKSVAPDIVTMDVLMPKMDGIQALKEIMKLDPKAKIIMVTTRENKAAVQEAMKLGAQDYILKPFERVHVGPIFERVKRLKNSCCLVR